MSRRLLCLLSIPLMVASVASAAEQPFPEGATTPSAQEIRDRLTGKVFNLQMPEGLVFRVEYSARGHFFLDSARNPPGYPTVGYWRAEDGKLCRHITVSADTCTAKLCRNLRETEDACVDVRVANDQLQIRRWDGGVTSFIPK